MIGVGVGTRGPMVAPITPDSLGDALVLWLRADTGITLTSERVSAWADKRGVAISLTQASESARPTVSTTPNGAAMVLFGGEQSLKATVTLAQPTEVLISARWNGAGEESPTLIDGATTNSMRLFKGHDVPTTVGEFTTGGAADINCTVVDETWYVYDALFNGASSRLSINDGAVAVDTGDAGTTNGGGLTLACAGSGTYFGKVDIAEVLVVSRALTPTERTSLIALMRTYAGF